VHALAVLWGAVLTGLVCLSLGSLILRDACRDAGVRFVTGGAVLSLLVFLLCSAGIAYQQVFFVIGIAIFVIAIPRPGRPRWSWWLIPFAAYFVFYLANAMAPEVSPDGTGYHLGLVARYVREHGFVAITDNFYAAMPGGVEMLFLFAFPFGGHSAAAMVHFTFLVALCWQVYSYARRAGFPVAGASAALLVFASPAAAIDGVSAYNDVALAAIAFTLFHLLQIWSAERSPRVLAAAGLVAGFAFASKYTAWPAVVYAVAFVAFKNRKAALAIAGLAALMIAPWLLKNWIYLQNPVAPFFNRLFPNPYVTPAFEDTYRGMMALYHLKSRWQIPMEVTTYGSISGLLGPVFLLSPLALLSLRRREARQLLLAALVFGANYFSNIAARFLLPPLPFIALGMTLAVSAVPQLAVAIALIHCVISWPTLVPRYAQRDAWRIAKFPWKEALRIKPEEPYLESRLYGYGVDRMIERSTPPGATVFTFTPIPEAYTSRHIRVEYQAAPNQIAGKILWTATQPEFAPTWRLRFAFPRQKLRGLRVVQTATGGDFWSVHELRVLDGGRELPRAPEWRLTAQPYPWGVQDAFDNSLATFWISGDTLKPGQFLEVDFHGEQTADAVVIETAPNQPAARLRLEGLDAAGRWHVLSGAPQASDAPRPLGLRRAVAAELKRRGIDYLLVFDHDEGANDLRLNSEIWGVRPVGEEKGARLYQLP
jgi:Dolichyl-phosphate-mannose-protein mannosyltransferase